MKPASQPHPRLASAALLAAAGVLALGCGLNRSAHRDPDLAVPREGTSNVGNLMTPHDREALARIAAQRARAPHDAYRIGPDDLLDVRIPKLLSSQQQADATRGPQGAALPSVAEAPVFQQGVRVNAAGDITLPFIGVVHVAGLTPTEVEALIARRLVAAGILVHPQVSVQVAEYRHQVVAVVGSVERPGVYPLTRPGATLADMVWAAGGPGKEAGRLVDFTPASDGGRPGSALHIDLDVLMKAMSAGPGPTNPIAAPGDVLALAPAGSVQVDGWVDKPGSYPVTRGLTLTGAVAAAGGHLFPADRAHVSVKRVIGPDQQHFFTVDLDDVAGGRQPDFPLTDGDVVNLPMSPVRVVPWSLWTLAREMVHVGGSFLLF